MRRIIVIMIVTCSGLWVQAQTNLDSLLTVWQDRNQSDSTRAVAFRHYIWNGFLFSQPDSASILAKKLVAFGREKNYLKARILGYDIQGIAWYLRGDYPQALRYYAQSLNFKEQLGDQKGIAATSNNIGLIYFNQGDYLRALDYYVQSLHLEEQIGNQKGVSLSLNNIGRIYNNLGDFSKALDYYKRSLNIKEELGDKKGVATTLNNIGIIFQYQHDYSKALEYHTRSLKIKEEIGDTRGMAPSLHNIGFVYQKQGNNSKALDYFNRSIKIKEEIGDQLGIAQSLNNIWTIYFNQGDYAKALYYCKESYAIAMKLGVLELQKNGCICLSETYKAMGNSDKALKFSELLIAIQDSLHTEETAKKLQRMEFKKTMFQDSLLKAEEARLVEKAHQEEVKQKNRAKNIFLGSGVILMFVSLGLWRGLQFVRRSRTAIAQEKEKSDNLLLNILPEEIADELKRTGKAKPRKYEQVSILFTDFVDFTRISEQMSPEELVAEINTCYKTFDRIIEKHGAEKIKTIGDAYLAVDGFGKEGVSAAENMVLAALKINDFITKRKKQREASGKPAFAIRAGIHTGDVIAGIVGEKKFQFDIWGDAVNTANRLVSHSDVGRVNVSQETFQLLKDDPKFTFTSRGKMQVKGKGEIEMWFIERADRTKK